MELRQLKFSFLLFVILVSCCKSSINIFEDNKTKSTHWVKNSYIDDILLSFSNNERFKNWTSSEAKVLFISQFKRNDKIFVRAIPSFKKKHMIPLLKNDYSAYLFYKDVFIIFWGDYSLFFKRNSSVKMKKIFDKNILKKVSKGEFYGCEFLIKEGNIKLDREGYFFEVIGY